MELTDNEAKAIKSIFSMYDLGTMSATEALWELEQLINNEQDGE